MALSRREFLKMSGLTAGGLLLPVGVAAANGGAAFPLHKKIGEVTSICPYCAVGCGLIVGTQDGRVVNIEGDPDHPINRGSLCSKGAATLQVANNDRRLTQVLYRAPGSAAWETKDWGWAIPQIARRLKDTRDTHWTARVDGKTVNRTEAIAFLGGSQNTNEECYLWIKALRAMGLVYIDHQARI